MSQLPKAAASAIASRQIKRQGVEQRAAVRKRIADAVRGGTPAETRRYLLPSCRVAEFAYPTVGEYLKLNERAVLLAAREEGEKATGADMAYYVKEASLRRFLVGLTNVPVPVVMKPGWDEEKAKEAATEAVSAMAAENAREALGLKDGDELKAAMAKDPTVSTAVQAERTRLVSAGAVEREVFRQRLEFEDVAATVAAANVQPVTDMDFDDTEHYLRQIQNARIGSPEADDWLALHRVTGMVIEELEALRQGATFGDPKAGSDGTTPRMTFRRPLRS